MIGGQCSAAQLIDRAEAMGLVIWSYVGGATWITGPEDADVTLIREIILRGQEVAAEVERRTPSSDEVARLEAVRLRAKQRPHMV